MSRRFVPVVACTGNAVLVWGGFVPGLLSFADGARYDLRTDEWELLPQGPLAGRVRAGTAWTGDELLVTGGSDHAFRIFDDGAAFFPGGASWRRLPPLPDGGRREAASCWTGQKLILFGGYDGNGDPSPTTLTLSPGGDCWGTLAFDPIRRNPSARVVWNGSLCVAWGGFERSAAQPTVYEPATNEWRLGRPAPLETRVGHVAVALAGRVLVWGGELYGKGFTDGAWYDPAADRWELIAPAPAAKPQARAVVVGDELVVFGGNVSGRDVNVLAYDLNEDRWDEPDIPFWPGSGSAVVALSDGRVAVWSGFERNPSDLAFLSTSS